MQCGDDTIQGKGGRYMNFRIPDMTDECRKAYLLGYRAGYQDAVSGKGNEKKIPPEPIEVLSLSTRAYNCLHFAGLRYISEVAALPEQKIIQMKNLGKVTANEIAVALYKYGIHGTDWDLFLL